MKISKMLGALIALCLSLSVSGIAHASLSCPGQAIKIVVPNPAGAGGDVLSRLLAEKVGSYLGQSVLVENRSGATTVIGTSYVEKSQPDGCTILSLTASGVVVSVLQNNLPYTLMKDFQPIIGVGSVPMALAVPVAANINSMADLEKIAKSGQTITYASGGVGSLAHLSSIRLINDLQGTGNHIPFRGNPDATQALLGNHVQLFFLSVADATSLIASGKAKILAVTAKERVAMLPNVPTMVELGFKDFTPSLWYGYLAPSKVPLTNIQQLYKAFDVALNTPEIKSKLRDMGFKVDPQKPDDFLNFMKEEAVSWGKVIKENSIK